MRWSLGNLEITPKTVCFLSNVASQGKGEARGKFVLTIGSVDFPCRSNVPFLKYQHAVYGLNTNVESVDLHTAQSRGLPSVVACMFIGPHDSHFTVLFFLVLF